MPRPVVVAKQAACREARAPAKRVAVPHKLAPRFAAAAIACMLSIQGAPALAGDAETSAALSKMAASLQNTETPVYFGSGCFWGRQHDFFVAEGKMGRQAEKSTAIVGYAGGAGGASKDGKVCYYSGPKDALYEKLGHAEVVAVGLDAGSEEAQFRMFAKEFFKQFNKTPLGMMRQDPQDTGSGYRNVVGLPGGTDSPLMRILQEENVNKMALLPGKGNEPDKINTVYIMDTDKFPFYRAEVYHQYHNGIGKAFENDYTFGAKKTALKRGLIGGTGCPDIGF
ncbi:unnamed protein product [Pedinophyceae sp. YPF-701]|nr:unnamed protein product [Pedinophyceae sp. YPF-701]